MSRILTFIILLTSVLVGCEHVNKKLRLEDDNIYEEFIEENIDLYTGIDVDLTPSSKE